MTMAFVQLFTRLADLRSSPSWTFGPCDVEKVTMLQEITDRYNHVHLVEGGGMNLASFPGYVGGKKTVWE